jgi:hypothetical protein
MLPVDGGFAAKRRPGEEVFPIIPPCGVFRLAEDREQGNKGIGNRNQLEFPG